MIDELTFDSLLQNSSLNNTSSGPSYLDAKLSQMYGWDVEIPAIESTYFIESEHNDSLNQDKWIHNPETVFDFIGDLNDLSAVFDPTEANTLRYSQDDQIQNNGINRLQYRNFHQNWEKDLQIPSELRTKISKNMEFVQKVVSKSNLVCEEKLYEKEATIVRNKRQKRKIDNVLWDSNKSQKLIKVSESQVAPADKSKPIVSRKAGKEGCKQKRAKRDSKLETSIELSAVNSKITNPPTLDNSLAVTKKCKVGGPNPYCLCKKDQMDAMIACDNAKCPTEWYHYRCVGLTKLPKDDEKWYCPTCK